MQRSLILLLACSLAAAAPVAAQAGTPSAPATLDARMQAFLREVEETPNTGLAAYFPRRGDWNWVQSRREFRGGATGTGIWRFPGAETARAIAKGGPVCDSFHTGGGEFGPVLGRLANYVEPEDGRWRRARGNRYVPLGASAASPVFVEWRREDGEWVVSAFGDEHIYTRGGPEPPRGPFVRDTTPVAEDTVFAPRDWYTITVEGRRLPTYGRPRAMDRDTLVRIGHLYGVNVYVERGEANGFRYLPVTPGQFQPYEHRSPLACE